MSLSVHYREKTTGEDWPWYSFNYINDFRSIYDINDIRSIHSRITHMSITWKVTVLQKPQCFWVEISTVNWECVRATKTEWKEGNDWPWEMSNTWLVIGFHTILLTEMTEKLQTSIVSKSLGEIFLRYDLHPKTSTNIFLKAFGLRYCFVLIVIGNKKSYF